jgi:hypothetical protein
MAIYGKEVELLVYITCYWLFYLCVGMLFIYIIERVFHHGFKMNTVIAVVTAVVVDCWHRYTKLTWKLHDAVSNNSWKALAKALKLAQWLCCVGGLTDLV